MSANDPPIAKKSWSGWKWLLIGCGGALIVAAVAGAIGVYLLSKAFSTDSNKAEAVAQEILQFEKPEEFKGEFAMSMGLKIAVLMSQGEDGADKGILALAAFPRGMNTEEMQRQMTDAMQRQRHNNPEAEEPRPSETFQVRGKDTVARVGGSRTAKNDGHKSLEYTFKLDGPSGGLVMLMIGGDEQMATHAWVQKFLNSIK